MLSKKIFYFWLIAVTGIAALHAADPVCTSASLLFSLQQQAQPREDETIVFEESDILNLWGQLEEISDPAVNARVHDAFNKYNAAKQLKEDGNIEQGNNLLQKSIDIVHSVWIHHRTPPKSPLTHSIDLNGFKSNKYISSEGRKKIKPWIIRPKNPILPALNAIFCAQRASLNRETMQAAGFKILQPHVCSGYIIVVKHPTIPGHLLKVYLDSQHRTKDGRSHWRALVRRCEGAKNIRSAIKSVKSRYFVVPDKWIYPLPIDPGPPPGDPRYTRKNVLLVVTDMNLASHTDNELAWKTQITKDHLNELYRIISRAGGGSYRADNIPLTKSGKFAFIDTEYPEKTPVYGLLKPYLSPEMQIYWDQLVKRG